MVVESSDSCMMPHGRSINSSWRSMISSKCIYGQHVVVKAQHLGAAVATTPFNKMNRTPHLVFGQLRAGTFHAASDVQRRLDGTQLPVIVLALR